MAKQKRGLGRGLNALFGETMSETGLSDNAKERSKASEKEKDETESKELEQEPKVQEDEASAPDSNVVITEQEAENAVVKERAASPRASQPALRQKKSKNAVQSRPAAATIDKEARERAVEQGMRKGLSLPIDKVHPNPDQPRTHFNEEQIEELARSIKKEGLLQPVVVREEGVDEDGEKTYQIIAGERRWQACKLLHMKDVPVRIMAADDDKALQLALIENVQRTDLNPIEEAYGYKRLMERMNMTQTEVAQAVSKGRSTIANKLRLLDLPENAQQALFEGSITTGHAVAILQVPDEEGRKAITDKILKDHLNVRQVEALARLMKARAEGSTSTPRNPMPLYFKKAAKELRSLLNTNVRMSTSRGKNRIEIEFKDEEDLQRIFSTMTRKEEDVSRPAE